MPSAQTSLSFTTPCGVRVRRHVEAGRDESAIDSLTARLDRARGAVLSSSFEYPSRYTRWDIGFVDPPIALEVAGSRLRVRALNDRGAVLAPAVAAAAGMTWTREVAEMQLPAPCAPATEERRTRGSALFQALRRVVGAFAAPDDPYLGLYGAFGFDLLQQLEPVPRCLERTAGQRDLVLYLPDELTLVDHAAETCRVVRYEFEVEGRSTDGLARTGAPSELGAPAHPRTACDHLPGAYAEAVESARARFLSGDMFEAVLTQTFFRRCERAPSEVFARLKTANPAPYGCLVNLGEGEFLIAASPEMFVRVRRRSVETCPISGTIARGQDALADARQILRLLNSKKDESELTMCTDVDRNDKSRVCEPGSVRVIGRRQLELYSRLIHTVDHVEGRLRLDCDALDAFLSHAWAVTVTGAPKRAAVRFIEETEKTPRHWYGGAVGVVNFNGDMNTGLTLRSLRLKEGIAEARVGATLLWDSVPEDEDAECRLKISAMLAALEDERTNSADATAAVEPVLTGRRVLVVDHEDSFVLTLADFLRQLGASVATQRPARALQTIMAAEPHLVVLSPGPGRPKDFDLDRTIRAARRKGLPLFGVCLGMQGLVEHFGGELRLSRQPVHGKTSRVWTAEDPLFAGLPQALDLGRYHSLYVKAGSLPKELKEIAHTDDGVVMAVRHRSEPLLAVQFHPESIMSMEGQAGLRILANACRDLVGKPLGAALV